MKKLLKKYGTFLKYIGISLLSFIIDISLFGSFNTFFKIDELPATILARVISSPINFLLNKKRVFKSNVKVLNASVKYFSLVIVQMFISGLVVDTICEYVTFNAVFIIVPVEIILFITNYLIQKYLIFKKNNS